MKKVLIATQKPFAKLAIDRIKEVISEAGYELVIFEKYAEQSDLVKAMVDINPDALIVRSDIVDRDVLDAAKNLKIVIRAGAGYDNLDLDRCKANNIVAMNTPGQNANAVAELVFGLIISLIRNGYDGSSGVELRGKKLGIHAYGYIGRIVGMIAKGFGMKVYAYDPFIDKVLIENDGVKYESDIADLYSKCQYVSVHLPLSPETRESIGYDLMKSMPEGAMIINTARKEVILENDLLRVFEDRPDFLYASDITPDCKDVFEEKYKGRYIFTAKKMGAQTAEANINAGVAAARQIVNFFEKDDVTFKLF